MNLEQGLKLELSAINGLENKIFPLTAPEGTLIPYLIYSLSGTERLGELITGFDGMVYASYQLDLYHIKYSNLKELMALAVEKLKTIQQRNIATTGPYVEQIKIENAFETFDSNIEYFHGIIECIFYYNEN